MNAWSTLAAVVVCAGGAVSAASAQVASPEPVSFSTTPDGLPIIDGHAFSSWEEYTSSAVFRERGLRCGLGPVDDAGMESPTHCASTTNPLADYDPSVARYRIPVVVHVIRQSNGTTGNISAAMVQSQIDILNEDFLAITGSLGQNGTNIEIEFVLASEDPQGNPTTGITYSSNTTWFNDSGSYWNSLAWDPDRYLNIYTNSASGALGYVPWLPHTGSPGSLSDRVVVLWSSFGRNAPIGHPYNLGRTATHEVGHYLGLYHTFDGGCGTTSCYTTGDRICDTNSNSQPQFGCPANSRTCNTPDPILNYMNYTDDPCMAEFTPEQARRMRCTLENWRVEVYSVVDGDCAADITGEGDLNTDDFFAFLALYQAQDAGADFAPGNGINSNDFFAYLAAYQAGC